MVFLTIDSRVLFIILAQAVAMPKDDDLSISVEVPDHMDEVSVTNFATSIL